MKLLRKTIQANSITEFKFDVNAYTFLVKNLTNGDILVCFDEFDETTNIKIPARKGQAVTQNTNHTDSKYATNTLKVKGSIEGEVEVQCLDY